MITQTALIQKVRARWQHYLLLGRWNRAQHVKRLLDRLERSQRMRCRQTA